LQRGVRRFLTFQTLGMGLIVLANLSILLATIQADLQIDLRVPLFALTLGYGLVLPIFPFHTWVSMISEKSEPYSSTFVLFMLPAANAYLILTTMLQVDISAIFPAFFSFLQIVAVLMIFLGGAWAALEDRLGKMIGFIMLQQIGSALLALSVTTSIRPAQDSPLNTPFEGLFFAHFLPSGVALAVLTLSISILQNQMPLILPTWKNKRPNPDSETSSDLQIEDIRRAGVQIMRQFPFASAGMLASLFSLAGLPILASFPIYLPLWSSLARTSVLLAALSLLGSGFIFLSGRRILNALIENGDQEHQGWFQRPPEKNHPAETRMQAFLLSVGMLSLLILGLIPNLYLPYLARIAISLTNPIP